MQLVIEKGDLFAASIDSPFCYAHCVSADFALGAGIAVQFDQRFQMRGRLHRDHPLFVQEFAKMQERGEFGTCLLEGNILNLITKLRYWEKPTRTSVYAALQSAKSICEQNHITSICMPKIAAGLDRRPWKETEADIRRVWDGTNMKIFVYCL